MVPRHRCASCWLQSLCARLVQLLSHAESAFASTCGAAPLLLLLVHGIRGHDGRGHTVQIPGRQQPLPCLQRQGE